MGQARRRSPVKDATAEAASPATSHGRLAELATHRSRSVRMAVADNPAASDELLALLADDTDTVVRMIAAQNEVPRPDLEEHLSRSPHSDVRRVLADKYRWSAVDLPWSAQYRLAQDSEKEVRERMAATTNYLDVFMILMADPLPIVRAYCSKNPRVTREQLNTLMEDSSYVVRASVAGGWAARVSSRPDDEQLLRLAADKSVVVRHNVVTRYDVPSAALALLRSDPDAQIREEAERVFRRGPVRIIIDNSKSGSQTPGRGVLVVSGDLIRFDGDDFDQGGTKTDP
jgi:hypothetical protein